MQLIGSKNELLAAQSLDGAVAKVYRLTVSEIAVSLGTVVNGDTRREAGRSREARAGAHIPNQ